MHSDHDKDAEAVFTISRRALRRIALVVLAVVVLGGVGVGAFLAGRSTGSTSRPATNRVVPRRHRPSVTKESPTTTTKVPATTTTTTSEVPATTTTTSPPVLPVVERCRPTTSTYTASTGPRFQRGPSAVEQTCRIPGGEGIGNVTWSSWTPTEAAGFGTWNRTHMCPQAATPTPECSPPVQVSITLSAPGYTPTGTLIFTKLVVTTSTGSTRTAGADWGAGSV